MIKKYTKYLFVFFMSSCSIDLLESTAYKDIFLYYKGYIAGFDSDEISKDVFDKYEYSFANVKIGRGPASTLVLAYIKNGVYEWRSNDGIKIFTFNGMIIQTIGLESDLKATHINILDESLEGDKHINFIAFKNPDLYRSPVYNKIFKHKSHTTDLKRLGGNINAEIIEHSFNMPIIKWKGNNKYYLYDNSIIRSEQYIHPNIPIVKMDFYLK